LEAGRHFQPQPIVQEPTPGSRRDPNDIVAGFKPTGAKGNFELIGLPLPGLTVNGLVSGAWRQDFFQDQPIYLHPKPRRIDPHPVQQLEFEFTRPLRLGILYSKPNGKGMGLVPGPTVPGTGMNIRPVRPAVGLADDEKALFLEQSVIPGSQREFPVIMIGLSNLPEEDGPVFHPDRQQN